jgi:tetratricopeptide (TPR) repeat protein
MQYGAVALLVACQSTAPPAESANANASKPARAGVMSAEAAHAKQLFDREQWGDAAYILSRVRRGKTDDDEGNRQLAAYHEAICYYRMKNYDDNASVLEKFNNPNQRDHYWTLAFLLGRYANTKGRYAEAVRLLGKVGAASKYFEAAGRLRASAHDHAIMDR